MRLYILFGQRKQRYAGEYAPEALEIMDEFAFDENPGWLSEKQDDYHVSDEFEALQIVPVTVSMDELKHRLIPVDSAIAGQLA